MSVFPQNPDATTNPVALRKPVSKHPWALFPFRFLFHFKVSKSLAGLFRSDVYHPPIFGPRIRGVIRPSFCKTSCFGKLRRLKNDGLLCDFQICEKMFVIKGFDELTYNTLIFELLMTKNIDMQMRRFAFRERASLRENRLLAQWREKW